MARILLVEDDIPLMRLYEGVLKTEHEVLAVASGTEAILQLESYQPDLVVQDLKLLDMSGEDLLEIVARETAGTHTKVIVITGFQRMDNMPDCVVEVLQKPVTMSVLLRVVNNVVTQYAPR